MTNDLATRRLSHGTFPKGMSHGTSRETASWDSWDRWDKWGQVLGAGLSSEQAITPDKRISR
jgi:hypothetical protein